MKYLLDTNAFLWAVASPSKLNHRTRGLLGNGGHALFLSAASSWEISVKHAIGKLPLPEPPSVCVPSWMQRLRLRTLDITQLHALAAGELPLHHRDPFDRMLVAQAALEHLVLLTGDRTLERYEVQTLWCGR